jgi:tRNA threonylcarbamoyladenosine biosynthesis protein TsaB
MKILLIDTCGASGSAALAQSDGIVASAQLAGRTASERLLPAIKELAASSGIGLQSLDAVVVVHGPGSFSGVRVGLSAAKGLCEALAVPLIAISRLAVLARLTQPAAGMRVHALLDAGRGEFYYGEYVDGVCVKEALLARNEAMAAIESAAGMVVTCEPVVAEAFASHAPQRVTGPDAAAALPLALARIAQRLFDDAATLDANYLRRTDAEIFAKPTPPLAPAIDSLAHPRGKPRETPVRSQ